MSCNPIGIPKPSCPSGTDTAGSPARFAAAVRREQAELSHSVSHSPPAPPPHTPSASARPGGSWCGSGQTAPPATARRYSSWHSDPNDPRFRTDVGRGRHLAREQFAMNTDPVDDGAAPDLGLGEQAKWQRPRNDDGCYRTILGANAFIRCQSSILGGTRLGPKIEQCRGPLRALATLPRRAPGLRRQDLLAAGRGQWRPGSRVEPVGLAGCQTVVSQRV